MEKATFKTALTICAFFFVIASCVPLTLGQDPLFKCKTIPDCYNFPACDFVLCVDGGCACQDTNVTQTKCNVDSDCYSVGQQFCKNLEGAVCREGKCLCAPDVLPPQDLDDVVSCSKKTDCGKVNVLCQPGTSLDCVIGECKCVESN